MNNIDTSDSAAETDVVREQPQLSDEDLRRVEQYLSSPVHQVERKPFKPWIMMAGLVGTVLLLSLLSWIISYVVLG